MTPTEFTPLASLFGGTLIGLAAVMLMALHGRVAGVSGIVGQLLPPYRDVAALGGALAFLAGLVVAVPVMTLLSGAAPAQTVSDSPVLLIAAGLLVGFGAAWGRGCTSGHGVCGVARLSPRSLAATAVFMATAVVTVLVMRHAMAP